MLDFVHFHEWPSLLNNKFHFVCNTDLLIPEFIRIQTIVAPKDIKPTQFNVWIYWQSVTDADGWAKFQVDHWFFLDKVRDIVKYLNDLDLRRVKKVSQLISTIHSSQ